MNNCIYNCIFLYFLHLIVVHHISGVITLKERVFFLFFWAYSVELDLLTWMPPSWAADLRTEKWTLFLCLLWQCLKQHLFKNKRYPAAQRCRKAAWSRKLNLCVYLQILPCCVSQSHSLLRTHFIWQGTPPHTGAVEYFCPHEKLLQVAAAFAQTHLKAGLGNLFQEYFWSY